MPNIWPCFGPVPRLKENLNQFLPRLVRLSFIPCGISWLSPGSPRILTIAWPPGWAYGKPTGNQRESPSRIPKGEGARTVDRSLYVAYNPWLVFATAPGHSLTNWSVLTMMKKFGIAAVAPRSQNRGCPFGFPQNPPKIGNQDLVPPKKRVFEGNGNQLPVWCSPV